MVKTCNFHDSGSEMAEPIEMLFVIWTCGAQGTMD